MKALSNYSHGDTIGYLTFIEKVDKKTSTSKFKCICGNEFITRTVHVTKNRTKSCGCKKKEFNRIASTRHAPVEYHASGIKKMPFLKDEDIKRFWRKVAITAQPNLCWNWLATGDRYGFLRVGKTQYKTNRMAYFLYYGVDPAELHVLHSCDNGKCCNPVHLSLGTHWDNMQDMAEKGRASKGRPKNKSNYY